MRRPLCNHEELHTELDEILVRQGRLDNAKVIAPHRAAELRATLNRLEHDLRKQIREATA